MDYFRNYHDNILIKRIQSPLAAVDHSKPTGKIVKPLHQIHLQNRKQEHDNAYLLDNIVNAKTFLSTHSPIYHQVSDHMRKNNDFVRSEKLKSIDRNNSLDKQRLDKIKSSYSQEQQLKQYQKSRQILFVRSNSPQKEVSRYSSYISNRKHDIYLKSIQNFASTKQNMDISTQFNDDYTTYSLNQIPQVNQIFLDVFDKEITEYIEYQ